jgi:hypothetical protein
MKLAVLSESSADEAAVRVLMEGILGQPTEPIALQQFATRRGWTSVRAVLPLVLKHLYFQTDADALAVVLDSDLSPLHEEAHELPGAADPKCRLCGLIDATRQTLGRLPPIQGRPSLRVAAGMAVPTLEAWLRCGLDAQVSEAAWRVFLQTRKWSYDRNSLKRAVYGTDRPPIQLETLRMTEEAQRLAAILPELEKWFPGGFGAMVRAVRGW